MNDVIETVKVTDTLELQIIVVGDRYGVYRPDYKETLDTFDTLEDARDAATMIAADIAWALE